MRDLDLAPTAEPMRPHRKPRRMREPGRTRRRFPTPRATCPHGHRLDNPLACRCARARDQIDSKGEFMEGTSAEGRYAASAAWLGMRPPPAEEFYGEADDRWIDGIIDETLGWLYPATATDAGQVAA